MSTLNWILAVAIGVSAAITAHADSWIPYMTCSDSTAPASTADRNFEMQRNENYTQFQVKGTYLKSSTTWIAVTSNWSGCVNCSLPADCSPSSPAWGECEGERAVEAQFPNGFITYTSASQNFFAIVGIGVLNSERQTLSADFLLRSGDISSLVNMANSLCTLK